MSRAIHGTVGLAALALGMSLAGCGGGGGSSTTGGCTQASDCQPGNYCADSTCKPKISFGACSDGGGHIGNDVCANGICLGGSCCVSKCLQGDPGCEATSCDPTKGTCIFAPDGGACGKEDCTNGFYTPPSTCDGTGLCRMVTPKQCDSSHCTGTACTPACVQSTDCDGGYCASKICLPQAPSGSPCVATSTSVANEACSSGVCLGGDAGRCCLAACPSTDTACAASACDLAGACVYPGAEKSCGTQSCRDADTQTPAPFCDAGGCQVVPDLPCAPFACNPAPGACYTACNAAGVGCDPSGFCLDGGCATKQDAGALCDSTSTSTADQACQSSLCSGGYCCLQSCPETPFTHCVGPCNASGGCATQTCLNGFGCLVGTANCAVGCKDNSSCDTDHFCLSSMFGPGSCCKNYQAGDTIYIDAAAGNDFTACCGTAAAPCQTLTKAMSLVNTAKVSGVRLSAYRSAMGVDWTNRETWPVHLGWGVTLDAPGIYFSLPSPGAGMKSTRNHFEVYSYGALDTATVTIVGGPTDATYSKAVHIGFGSSATHGGALSGVIDPPAGKTPVPLQLSSVWIDTFPTGAAAAGLDVGPLATAVLGPLPVLLGNPTGISNLVGTVLSGQVGLSCHGAGAAVSDDPTATGTVLLSANTTGSDLDISAGCQVALTQGPILGTPLVAGSCDTSQPGDLDGILVNGGSTVVFGSQALPGTIECCTDNGVNLAGSDVSGSPSVTLDHVSVLGAACAGVYVGEGTLTATASSFTQNVVGVWADLNAVKVDLSGGNTMTCNGSSSIEPIGGCTAVSQPPVGLDLLNSTGALGVNAQGATWDNWDAIAGQTQLWSCSDTTYSSCTCTGPGCPGGGSSSLPSDADAVFLTSNSAVPPIDSSGGAGGGGCP